MLSEFKEFCQTFSVEHITIALYHPRCNGQAKRFDDTFKGALKKVRDNPTHKAIQQFLQVYRVTPYKNAPPAMVHAEVMYSKKINQCVQFLPNQSNPGHTNKVTRKRFKIGDKVFFCMFQSNKSYWETGTVDKKIGNMIYIIKGSRFTHKKAPKLLVIIYHFPHNELVQLPYIAVATNTWAD